MCRKYIQHIYVYNKIIVFSLEWFPKFCSRSSSSWRYIIMLPAVLIFGQNLLSLIFQSCANLFESTLYMPALFHAEWQFGLIWKCKKYAGNLHDFSFFGLQCGLPIFYWLSVLRSVTFEICSPGTARTTDRWIRERGSNHITFVVPTIPYLL